MAPGLLCLAGSSLKAMDQPERETVVCESLQHCKSQIGSFTSPGPGIWNSQWEFAGQFQKFGEPALVYLLGLLESQDEGLLNVVGAAIAQFEDIGEKHLQSIVAGVERDVPWLVRALGSIKTAAAAKVAVDLYLNAKSSPHNQEAVAVSLHEDRAIPHIVEAATCERRCVYNHTRLLSYVLGDMAEETRSNASAHLVEALRQPGRTITQQANLLSLFDGIGAPGLVVERELVQFRDVTPVLAAEVDRALVGIRSSHSGRIFGELLRQQPSLLLLRDVAEVGRAAVDAGPAVVELLSHPDSDTRLGAALALGFIEYGDAVPNLESMLDDGKDVRVNWAAAESLGRIGDEAALDALRVVQNGHWYPPVRAAAGNAIARIEETDSPNVAAGTDRFITEFYRYENFGHEACRRVALNPAQNDRTRKVSRDGPEHLRTQLAYDSEVVTILAADADEQRKEDPNGIIRIHPGNAVEEVERIVQVPDVALKVDSGWLAGSSRGEFGGELMHISSGGQASRVLEANVEGIYVLGSTIVATTGLAHLSSNHGRVYRLDTESDGAWKASVWAVLPGAPRSSWIAATGELVIDTHGGGSILLSEEGGMRMAPCVER